MKKLSLSLFALTLAFAPLASSAAYANECTGGTITHVGPWTIHTFTSTGSTTFTCPISKSVEYLVVAGGGGGGSTPDWSHNGGGGGAGGLLAGTGYVVAANSAVTVTVGAGGAGGSAGAASDGGGSVFGSITTTGGGHGGGNGAAGGGGTGGSGGGSTGNNNGPGSGTAGQGYAGGSGSGTFSGAGGGGAGSIGGTGSASGNDGGNGGTGYSSPITGVSTGYAGGGGGAGYAGGSGLTLSVGGTGTSGGATAPSYTVGNGGVANGNNGTANTGGGGSAGISNSAVEGHGGSGGSGIVIVRYITSGSATASGCSGGTITYVGAYTIHTFTSTGSTTFSCPTARNVEYLVVAGGGGGGIQVGSGYKGGGGGGGVVAGTGYAVASGVATTVTVGAGGIGATTGSNGSNSVFGTVTAVGGGAGGGDSGSSQHTGVAGGSGGGAGQGGYAGGAATQGNSGGGTGYGFAGGSSNASNQDGGGGGGAGAVGGNGDGTNAGVGGIGISSSITGTATYYAGGGGGGDNNGSLTAGGSGGGGSGGFGSGGNGTNGTANTGGGGGGAGYAAGASGNGGSGIVVVRYVTAAQAPATAKFKSLGKISLRGVKLSVNYIPPVYIENVFSAYTYTGNGSTQTITNGINLSSFGGLVWIKNRTNAVAATVHRLFDTVRGHTSSLSTENTNAADAGWGSSDLIFGSTGFTLGAAAALNNGGDGWVSWSFAQAPKFFKTAVQVHTNGVADTISLASLGTVGMVTVKRTDSTSDWYTWHRSLTVGKLVYLDTTAAETADTSISVSGTTLTLSSGLATGTYIIYAWAHDTSTNGLIQCGSLTTNGSGAGSATLGWEPQYVIIKNLAGENWYTLDSTRGWSMSGQNYLYPNLSNAEGAFTGQGNPTATGFQVTGYTASNTYTYCAIRRGPMQQPTAGTQVYNAIARTGTGAAATVTGVGFPPDLVMGQPRDNTANDAFWMDRLRGSAATLLSDTTTAERASGSTQDLTGFGMDGFSVGTVGWTYANVSAKNIINWVFRRYPGVFDEVAYTGTGVAHTEAHNLGVAPELMIIKKRSAADLWMVYAAPIGNTKYLILNATNAQDIYSSWNNTTPTASVFSLGSVGEVNLNAATFVAYLFASKPGVSKVGSYTGNGGTLNINAAFTATVRFVMIKRTDSTGDWYVWDSTRGINAGANDPHLSLNTTAAEVTTDDSIDPYTYGNNSGFTVKQNATTNVNVTNATYIYLAFQ